MTVQWVWNPDQSSWHLTGITDFHGRVARREDGRWWGWRSQDPRVPALGPFDTDEAAKENLEAWARDLLAWQLRRGSDQAANAAVLLMEMSA